MKTILKLTTVLALVAGCTPKEAAKEDYFESINPDPAVIAGGVGNSAELALEEERLRAAEQGDIIDTTVPLNTETSGNVNSNRSDRNIDELLAEAERLRETEGSGAAPLTTAGADGFEPGAELATTTPVLRELTEQEKRDISNNQNFEIVSERETIETDAAKLNELRRTYKVFGATSLPTRRGKIDLTGFAKDNQNKTVGRKKYPRKRKSYENAGAFCADYKDQDLAQLALLANGGPKKDPLLLDRDGDGFACAWTPKAHLSPPVAPVILSPVEQDIADVANQQIADAAPAEQEILPLDE